MVHKVTCSVIPKLKLFIHSPQSFSRDVFFFQIETQEDSLSTIVREEILGGRFSDQVGIHLE